MTAHWHAYAYTGKGYTDNEIRKGVAPPTFPPIEIKDWLHRRAAEIFPETSLDNAMVWLEKELNGQPPIDAEAYPIETRLASSRARLQETVNRNVVYGYWSRGGQYVSRVLICCERSGCSV